jgi:hypothetical protein
MNTSIYPKAAYVLFRSMESRERALIALNVGWFDYFKQFCCFSEAVEMKKFKGEYLKVREASDPELINWTNWG